MIASTMGDFPLTINSILRHGRLVHGESVCVTLHETGVQRTTYAEVADNADRLAAALGTRLGIGADDRVGTFMWNSQEHLEAYFAIPSMGAVLHTLNIRLFPEQLLYITNHARDRIVIVDDTLVDVIGAVADQLSTVEAWIVVGNGQASLLESSGRPVYRYHELLAMEQPGYEYPEPDERTAAAMCYTSGTTGDPKGVAYSHRSTYLHSLAACTPAVLGLGVEDRVLTIVPQFHANAWGMPYAAFLSGASLLMPGRFLQAEPLARFIATERPTVSAAVPTIRASYRFGDIHAIDVSSLRIVVCGGAALPRSLMERFQQRDGLRLIQGWGMTEMSPVGAVGHPPTSAQPGSIDEMDWRAKTGRVVPGVELRIVDDEGLSLPWDGAAVGEIEVRGPWITSSYWEDPATDKFHDGWLRTGDLGTVTSNGYIQITDRAKDVIKSGGEWISSVELENALMAHPSVVEAAVIGIPDPRWDERPLACVVVSESLEVAELKHFLAGSVAKWQLPEHWTFVAAIPKTSVGKFDKKALRSLHENGDLAIVCGSVEIGATHGQQ